MARHEEQFKKAFLALKQHASESDVFDIRASFDSDPQRFDRFSLSLDDLLIDFSKSAIDAQTIALLDELGQAADVAGWRDDLFSGKPINVSEHRSALHTALRMPADQELNLCGRDVVNDVHSVLKRMEQFSNAVREGELRGETDHKITDVVNIGIGGSDLGPVMATLALKPYHNGPKIHFVSNIDAADIVDCLTALNPETTLVIVASKTFTTSETMTNARIARQWIVDALGEMAVAKHFAGISTAIDKVSDFGIDSSRAFAFWNWVGGRYSIWSAVGLSVMLAIGPEQFQKFRDGAYAMDKHFQSAPSQENLPVMLALIGYWNRVICNYPTRAVIPYEHRLSRLPAYLQQLDMESNGKRVTLEGVNVTTPTGPIVWGEPGTNAQHAFFQLLHQGSDIVPVEFVVFVNGHEPGLKRQHAMLIANCLAQSEALLKGRSLQEAYGQLLEQGMGEIDAENLAPHKVFPGNRPTMTIVQDRLTPFALGRLIALYEHRTFVEGVLMNIDSFDQWGVELGKELASELLPLIADGESVVDKDASTLGLLSYFKARKK